jgi:recombination protein RecR
VKNEILTSTKKYSAITVIIAIGVISRNYGANLGIILSFEAMDFSSKYIQNAVDQFATLPGIGKRTALRLVLHLLKQEEQDVVKFSNSFTELMEHITYCGECNNISDTLLCEICSNPNRDTATICVVEDLRDVMAIENTHNFKGLYHVLGGIISPMDGIGPNDLKINSLIDRIDKNEVKEIIFALSATMEGDTTNFYIFKKLKDKDIRFSTIARGVAIGDELEYTDEITLGRSIVNRTPYENSLSQF